jgi:hypothetical protein
MQKYYNSITIQNSLLYSKITHGLLKEKLMKEKVKRKEMEQLTISFLEYLLN